MAGNFEHLLWTSLLSKTLDTRMFYNNGIDKKTDGWKGGMNTRERTREREEELPLGKGCCRPIRRPRLTDMNVLKERGWVKEIRRLQYKLLIRGNRSRRNSYFSFLYKRASERANIRKRERRIKKKRIYRTYLFVQN